VQLTHQVEVLAVVEERMAPVLVAYMEAVRGDLATELAAQFASFGPVIYANSHQHEQQTNKE
jgi:hypothetical protein